MEKLEISSPAAPNEVPEALQAPTKPVSFGFILALLAGNTAFTLCYINILGLLLPLQVSLLDPVNKVTNLAVLNVVGGAIGILSAPLAGAFSDRTTSRFGRRRPWIFVGTLLSPFCLLVMLNARTFVVLFLAWCALQFCFFAILSSLIALVPDFVPARQRGVVSSALGLSISLGVIIGSVLFGQIIKGYIASYMVIIGVILVVFLPFAIFLREKVLPKGYLPPFRVGTFLKAFWISPRKHPDFAWGLLSRFFPFLGYTTGFNLLFYYLQDAVKYQKIFPGQTALQGASTLYIVETIFLVVSTIIGGVVSDKLQRRKELVAASIILIGIALLIMAFFPIWQVVLVAAVVLGLGLGVYVAVHMSLITLVLPSAENRGKDLGVINSTQSLAQTIAAAFGGILIAQTHNYTLLFLIAAITTFVGIFAVLQIKTVR